MVTPGRQTQGAHLFVLVPAGQVLALWPHVVAIVERFGVVPRDPGSLPGGASPEAHAQHVRSFGDLPEGLVYHAVVMGARVFPVLGEYAAIAREYAAVVHATRLTHPSGSEVRVAVGAICALLPMEQGCRVVFVGGADLVVRETLAEVVAAANRPRLVAP